MVQSFETVDVSEDHGIVIARVPANLRMASLQAVQKEATVGQIGQCVMQCVVCKLFFGAHALGHVAVKR